jgi:peptidoglycan hydrolase-like protein with peptidoglycan-binding domain
MKQRCVWISAALTSWMAGTALGQQPYTYPDPSRQNQSKQVEEAKDEQIGEVASGDDASSDRTSRHLYGIQVDSVRLSALDKDQVMQLQRALQKQGYYTAAVDGVVGPKTNLALRRFYLDQAGLAAQGLILPQGAASLGLDEADIERVRGKEEAADIERVRGKEEEADIERVRREEQRVRARGLTRGEHPRGPTLPMKPDLMEDDEPRPVPKR